MIYLLPGIKKKSAWQFVTCEGAALSLGYVTASGGWILLSDPSKREVKFYYGGAGGGLSAQIKIPKIGKKQIDIPPVTGAGSEAAFPSMGELFITTGFQGNELRKSDIEGTCAFVEIGIGVIAGVSGTLMLLGVDPFLLAKAAQQMGHAVPITDKGTLATVDPNRAMSTVIEDIGFRQLFNSARAVLRMGGINVGIQAGAGVSGCLGYLHS
ncbi:MAG TPA: hypothetical protein VK619_19115 [Pyrinomonadaceae bacterium]|nr:hypothetical protein [Pyrinomonadaceae bacterium]